MMYEDGMLNLETEAKSNTLDGLILPQLKRPIRFRSGHILGDELDEDTRRLPPDLIVQVINLLAEVSLNGRIQRLSPGIFLRDDGIL
jgi:hypothetical protein